MREPSRMGAERSWVSALSADVERAELHHAGTAA